MIKVLPSFRAVSRRMLPPISSTRLLVMAMPRPVPWMPLTVELRSRSKASNTFSANSSLMPMPVSLTFSS